MTGSPCRLTAGLSLFSLLWQLSNPEAAHSQVESVFRMARDGSSIERLSSTEGRTTPTWRQDGRLLYVAHTENGNEFHLASPAGEVLLRVPVPPRITSVGGVSWFPDGTRIAFAGKTEELESYDIYVMKLGAGDAAIEPILADAIQPALSPDGQHLAFTTHRDGNLELYVADHHGRNLRHPADLGA